MAEAKGGSVLERLKVEYVPIASLRANSYNPNVQRAAEFALLTKSIEEDGFTQPIVVQRDTREIVDGEHRWNVAKMLGMAEVPVVFVDMSAEQMRISTIRHNRARGSEDDGLMTGVMRELEGLGALDMASESLLMGMDEIDKLLEGLPEEGAFDVSPRRRIVDAADSVPVSEDKGSGYTVRLFFVGAEAGLVSSVLGDDPAGRLLELCEECS